jgi:multidrug efflux pump
MLLSDIAVKRPILASAANALLVVFGLFAILNITVREYPDIDPPVVSVRSEYPGAAASIVESRVTQVIEEQVAGIEGIRELSSQSRDGRSDINIEFELSRDIDAAANDVRDRVSRAVRNLPQAVDPPIVSKQESDASPILWLVLSSDRMSAVELADYADRFLVDRLGQLSGVSRIRLGGDRLQSMRIWLDPTALAARNLSTEDIEAALRRQNIEQPAGRIESETRELALRQIRPYESAKDFAAMVVDVGDDGYPVRLGDVATVQTGAAEERRLFHANGEPAVGIGIVKQSSANTLAVAQAVKAQLPALNDSLPEGAALRVNSDFSLFIEASLKEVLFTLAFAGMLVVLVIWAFLGSLRATLIPAATVPISLTAAFILVYAFGFSINILTLLALVLAIGLVVDDTIVVVENIHRRIEDGEPPLLAAFRGTREVGFAVIATTAVLIAVFTPLAFLEGNVGRLFREFALSLAAAVLCSSFVALTLSPVLTAALIRHRGGGSSRFDRGLGAVARGYGRLLGRIVARPSLSLVLLAVLLAGAAWLFSLVPREFAPTEDRGQFFVNVTAPEGASFDYTRDYMLEIEAMLLERMSGGEIERMIMVVPGFGAAEQVNSGILLISLTEWEQRDRPATRIAAELRRELRELPGVQAAAFQRGAFGLRFGQPVQFVLGGSSYDELVDWRDRIIARLNEEDSGLTQIDSDFKRTKPELAVRVDLDAAGASGVSVERIGRTLETMLGGRRVTTYIERGEEYDVWLRGGIDARGTPDDLGDIHVRSDRSGELISLANLLIREEGAAAPSLNRFNQLRSVTIDASLSEGASLGAALENVRRIVKEEAPGAVLSWTGESRDYFESGADLYISFAIALVVVFLVLSAQFESFINPVVILTTVPLAVFGALLGLLLHGLTINIYSQIGIIMLIGLAAKNGILIVEFANQRRDAGHALREAVLDAAQTRFRPILMTTISTGAGVLPLYFAAGAGSEARQMLGVVVFWGVLFSAVLTLFVVPALYGLMARRAGMPGRQAQRLASQEAATRPSETQIS